LGRRRLLLVLAWTLVVAADLFVFMAWMGADLDENCGDVGQGTCNEFLRHSGLPLLLVMLLVTVGVGFVVFRAWRKG
jgi:hypothetical protein